jgi:hypothetical protein
VTDYTALVAELYRALGTWQRVATACGGYHSRGYYQQVASGRPAIAQEVRRGH